MPWALRPILSQQTSQTWGYSSLPGNNSTLWQIAGISENHIKFHGTWKQLWGLLWKRRKGRKMGAFHILQTVSGSQAAKLSPQSPQGTHRWIQTRTKVPIPRTKVCVHMCVCVCVRARSCILRGWRFSPSMGFPRGWDSHTMIIKVLKPLCSIISNKNSLGPAYPGLQLSFQKAARFFLRYLNWTIQYGKIWAYPQKEDRPWIEAMLHKALWLHKRKSHTSAWSVKSTRTPMEECTPAPQRERLHCSDTRGPL